MNAAYQNALNEDKMGPVQHLCSLEKKISHIYIIKGNCSRTYRWHFLESLARKRFDLFLIKFFKPSDFKFFLPWIKRIDFKMQIVWKLCIAVCVKTLQRLWPAWVLLLITYVFIKNVLVWNFVIVFLVVNATKSSLKFQMFFTSSKSTIFFD